MPGNHDLQRPNPEDAEFHAELTLLGDWAQRPKMREKFWGYSSSRYRKVVDRAFSEYTAWSTTQPTGKHPGLKDPLGPVAGRLRGDF